MLKQPTCRPIPFQGGRARVSTLESPWARAAFRL